ncbi:lipase [Cerasibacillus terrae]|uniref:Lipase n=1 Tax=Cerasibacillus terrae TaxID=2498845 RepID=A0A5C8NI70_9BACI|nr:lipase [Cerasibacillus terrae]TXL57866.1 lipase [Cerasibacillus terrae]
MITNEDYKIFSDISYWIESNRNHVPFIPNQDDVLHSKDLKGLSKNYKVLKTEDNTTNGMQAMAVAPVKNGKADTSEIVIAYAGTNFDDELDLMTDAQTVVLGNKVLIPESQQLDLTKHNQLDELGIPKSIEYVDGQVMTAQMFFEEIKTNYPKATITTTGHSLGEYIALYISAENGLKNVGFNGPDPYNILSPKAKEWIKENPGMLYNYRNEEDKIGNYGGNGTRAEILVNMDMGGHIKDTLEFHGLGTWEFDEEGKLVIKDTLENREARQTRAEKKMYLKMNELSILSKRLKASGGGLSSNEEIFLDNTQALLAVDYISKSMKIGIETVVNIYLDAIAEAEETWKEGIRLAQSIGTELSYDEILNALQAGGVTKHSVVFEPAAYYREKISEALEIGGNFDHLVFEIKESIRELEETDRELANQIEQGSIIG